jgi:hypothetical protein
MTASRYLCKDVWLKNDAAAERDAMALWRASADGMPPDATIEDHVKELAVAAYDGDTLVATTTCRVAYMPKVRQNLAMFRLFIAPSRRRERITIPIVNALADAMAGYSRDNLEKRIGGLGAIVVTRGFLRKGMTPIEGLGLVGYTDGNQPIIVKWFDHFRINEEATLKRIPQKPKEDRYG